jgi:hypothetical protein
MPRNIAHEPKLKKKFYPLISVCTPTFNRRPFIPTMFECFKNQTYPRDRMEWIIVDDGTDKIQDLISQSGIPQIKYYPIDKKMTLGAKRNLMHSYAKGTIIVYMDDDDYYPPERVQHAVETLTANKEALCAGASEIYIYFKHVKKMIQCGPYGPNHATAGTFAFRAELLKQTKYEDTASLAEEKQFLKGYTVPFVQLDPLKTILVFSHEHNTFDKRRLFDNPHPDYFKESPKSVNDFIRKPQEAQIKKFFMEDIDALLKPYKAGEPSSKPDVLKQIKEIDEERAKMAEGQGDQPTGIMLNRQDGSPPVNLTQKQVAELLQQHQSIGQQHQQKIAELENMVTQLQKQLADKQSALQKQLADKQSALQKQLADKQSVLQKQLADKQSALQKQLADKQSVLQKQLALKSAENKQPALKSAENKESTLQKQLDEKEAENKKLKGQIEELINMASKYQGKTPDEISTCSNKLFVIPDAPPLLIPPKSKSQPEIVFKL